MVISTTRDETRPGPSARTGHSVLVCHHGEVREDVPVEEIDQHLAVPGTVVWLDVERPSEDDLSMLEQEFKLHPLAVQDLRLPHQRPKVDEYDDQTLIVVFESHEAGSGRHYLSQVAVFIGPNFLISVHDEHSPAIQSVRERWHGAPSLFGKDPLGFLLYKMCSAIVDTYFPAVDVYEEHLDQIEDGLFQRFERSQLQAILRLRRDLIELRRALTPQRDVFTALSRHDIADAHNKLDAYFADLVDLTLRLGDTVDTLRDRLGAALDSYLTIQSNALNETMKRLTAFTVVLTLPMIVSGFYGMNFDDIPGRAAAHGFGITVAVTVLAVMFALFLFRRNDWL